MKAVDLRAFPLWMNVLVAQADSAVPRHNINASDGAVGERMKTAPLPQSEKAPAWRSRHETTHGMITIFESRYLAPRGKSSVEKRQAKDFISLFRNQ